MLQPKKLSSLSWTPVRLPPAGSGGSPRSCLPLHAVVHLLHHHFPVLRHAWISRGPKLQAALGFVDQTATSDLKSVNLVMTATRNPPGILTVTASSWAKQSVPAPSEYGKRGSSTTHFSLQMRSTKSVLGSIMTMPPRKVVRACDGVD